MSSWFESAINRAVVAPGCLAAKRQQALDKLQQQPWPTRKTEAWKYTPLHALAAADFSAVSPADNAAAAVPVVEGLGSIDLVFVDGALQSDLSQLPAGVTATLSGDADTQQQMVVTDLFGSVKPERHLFGLVNDVLAEQVLLLQVAEGVQVAQPLRIINIVSQGTECHTRLLVSVAKGAKLTVVEQTVGDAASFNTTVSEYAVADNARLEHYRFALQQGASMNVGGCHFRLGEQAELNSTVVGFGSQLSRLDVDVHHAGEKADAKINAIYLLDGAELFDLHSTIEHAVPHCTTEENVRGIVADKARAVFNGRIHIHRNAQKTLAELNNRNLLLSREAEINTKPELEIYADDVRCAHGATVAEIDKKALYYLRSRGVSAAQAHIMLNFGFINELVDQMPSEALAQWLRPQLRQRFAAMKVK
jgi:Fe-S cluster assembly protein SufD